MTTIRKRIRIQEANNNCVQLPGNIRGFVYNVYTYTGTVNFQILKFPSMDRDYKEVTKDFMVSELFEEELKEIAAKYGDRIIGTIPQTGCSLGTDPEVFVVDEHGVVIPAFKFLPDKDKAVPMSFRYGDGRPFWDGFQAEFTTDVKRSPNSSCLSFTIDDVRNGLREVLRAAKKFDPKAKLTWRSVLDIPNHIMDEADPIHRELGCLPSKNAYPHIKPLVVDNPSALPFRFAGCHLHLGFDSTNKKIVERVVKTIDAVWGTISICLFRGMEDKRRRIFYGRAGEYRDPSHGIEYRTTSSAALAHPVLLHLAFDISRAAAYIGMNEMEGLWKADEEDIVGCINEYDVAKAETIVRTNEGLLNSILRGRYTSLMASKVLDMIYDGALNYFNGLTNMVASWKLNTYWSSHSSTGGTSVYNAKGSDLEGAKDRGYEVGDPGGITDRGAVQKPRRGTGGQNYAAAPVAKFNGYEDDNKEDEF